MKVNVEELSSIERKLSIEVEQSRVAEELDRAYAALGRQVKIPGFRPGKVPRRILEARFREQIEDEVAGRVIQSAYLEAVREKNVDVVSQPQVMPGKLVPQAPFTFEARVEVKPTLDPKDYDGLPLPKRDVTVDDAKVAEQLEQMRQRFANVEPVQGRDTATTEDLVTIDFDATVDGKPFPGSQREGVVVEVAPGELVESRIAALEGAKVGDTRELDYAFPPDYQVEEVKGRTAHFKITVRDLKRRVEPELNDDFAKDTGIAQGLEELRGKVRADLERAAKSEAEVGERDALFKALIERNPFEVPRAMVERAVDMMLEGALRNMMRSGIDVRRLNLDFGALRGELKPRAEQEVRGTLLLEAIALKEKIQASDVDVDARIESMAQEAGPQGAAVRRNFGNPDQRESLALRLREEKTVEFLKSRAKYS
ncbi:MAG: trigger factor [Myxococcaceae bacterium]|nr:trigger factor [Myxococcaceae bacterium]MCI0671428.1 trigger factor [Myxococcaceae bacterium]